MKERIVFLDWLRVLACLMVILVHCTEPFYLGDGGTLITSEANAVWSTLIDSPLRSAVPLFVLTSSYLLFPVKGETRTFLKRRFTRVGIPFLFWLLFYAFVPAIGSSLSDYSFSENLKHLLLNFPDAGGHLWFLYMLLGVYLFMPMLSPWVEKLSKRGEEWFLALWLLTTLLPYLRRIALEVYGLPEVWGEASWNEFGILYYFNGFIGYVVMGHYFKKYIPELTWKKTLSLALPLWIVGYAIVAGGFWYLMPKGFPIHESIDLAKDMETTWTYCSLGVVMTTVAYFLIARKFTADGTIYKHLIVPLSKLSYGIYLVHIFLLGWIFGMVSDWFSAMNPWIAPPFIIMCSAVLTFAAAAIVTKLISYLPGHRYIIG